MQTYKVTYIMDSFWIMLRECDTQAAVNNDPVLKHWVEGFYKQWSSFASVERLPSWKDK